MDSLLEIRDLKLNRGNQVVLNIPQLEVQQGEVLAVIGPNGAGKSTLLLCLAGLLHPDHGAITFKGKPLTPSDELAYRRRIGLVLQDPLLLKMRVCDNIAAGLRFHGLARQEITRRVGTWLEHLGISHLRNRPANRLSGGEAQRVSLARALALQPDLLLLDEPFSALDAPTRSRLLEDFKDLLTQTSLTSIFVTHDLDEALFLGDRVAVIMEGEIRQVGHPEEVFSAPADSQVAALVGIETVIKGQVLESNQGLLSIAAGEQRLSAVGDAPPGSRVLLCLRPEDITLFPDGEKLPSSARNHLHGQIARTIPKGPLVRVVVDCGFPLVSLVTRSSLQELDLHTGQTVVASFKASAVHLIPR